MVTFPDVNQSFQGTLVAPGRIVWNNNTDWLKLPYVPDVTGDSLKEAVAALKAAGFTAKTRQGPSCGSGPVVVSTQAPMAGTQADSGSQVRITKSNC
ncbi:MAG TPA: PASTA domain-containing protein [Streptosporangiaceae bacterium]